MTLILKRAFDLLIDGGTDDGIFKAFDMKDKIKIIEMTQMTQVFENQVVGQCM